MKLGASFLILLLIAADTQSDSRMQQEDGIHIMLATNPKPTCKAKVDVGFILDSSSSLKNYYQKEKDFLKALAGGFEMGDDGSRFAVITFSYYTQLSIKFRDYKDITSFNKAVDAIPLFGSTTRIDKALRLTQSEMFTLANGARAGIPKLLILLTDGSQTNDPGAKDPADIAEELRTKQGITVLVVGIGAEIKQTELDQIAGGKNNVFNAASFDDLISADFIKQLAEKSCEAATTPKPTCKAKVDVGFILDSSGSLKNYYQKEKDFLKALAGGFRIGNDGSRFAVITFSYYTQLSIKFREYKDITSFNKAVDAIPFMGSTTRIDKALRQTQSEMFTLANGARAGIPKLLILLTDGSQTKDPGAKDPADIAKEIRTKQGITVLVVGIGAGIKQTELDQIAGGKNNVFNAASFDDLISANFIKQLTEKSCEAATTPKPTCKAKVDVGFILDSSGSLKNYYQKEKDFLKALAGGFRIGDDGSRFAVITFSYYTQLSISFRDYKDITSFNKAVDAIPLFGSTTRIDKALRLTQSEMFTLANGARAGIPKLLILLTDGSQTKDPGAKDPADIAKEIRTKQGITVLVIGIGAGIKQTELDQIAGGKNNVFNAASFDDLISADFIKQLTEKSCEAATNPKTACKANVDVGFILDSSGSLRNYYQKEKDFLKALAGGFRIGNDGSRFAVITFSYHTVLSIKLRDQMDITSFNKAVDAIPFMGSTTRIDKALRQTQSEMFTLANGARAGIPKLLILLTDGSQTKDPGAKDPADIAEELRTKQGITVLVVGIGAGIKQTELNRIAGGKNNVFNAASFDDLISADFIKQLTEKSCEAV